MRILSFLILILLFISCSKETPDEFMWEKTRGSGAALVSEVIDDSLFAVAGISDSKAIFLKTDDSGVTDIEYLSDRNGAYTSLVYDDSGVFLAGYSSNNIILTHINTEGDVMWDTLISVITNVNQVCIEELADGSLFVLGSTSPDSLISNTFDLITINKSGTILEQTTANPGFKGSISDMVILSNGIVCISLTKNQGGENSLASVAALTPEGNIIWETELFNNPAYAATSNSIKVDGGELFVAGSLERLTNDNLLINSFAATLTTEGNSPDKEFLENSNSGVDLAFDSNMNLVVLNKNCLVLNILPVPFNDSNQRFRVLDVCDSYDTEIIGRSLSITSEDEFFITGSKGGKFYFALRSGISD